MSRGSSARVVACLGLLAVFVCVSSATPAVPGATADRNRDGRSDIWTCYDAAGQVIRVDTDTNFTDGDRSYLEWLAPSDPNRAGWPVARATRTGGNDGRLHAFDDPFRSRNRLAAPVQYRDRPAVDSEVQGDVVVPATIVSFSTTGRVEVPPNPAGAGAPLLVGPTRSPPVESRKSKVTSR